MGASLGQGLPVHLALAILLWVGLVAYVRPSWGCIFDEGLYVLQAKALADHHSMIIPDPVQWLDPTGASNPLGPGGIALNRRHPFYPWILSVGYRAFGEVGFVLPSLLGTLTAGISVWFMLGSHPIPWRLVGFWLTVIFSPLLVDSALIFAHALGAGAAGLAVLGLLKWTSGASLRWLMLSWGASALLFAVRTEGVLLIGAVGSALCFEARRSVPSRRRNLLAALSSGAVFLGVMAFERHWRSVELGTSGPLTGAMERGNLPLHVLGAFRTLLGFGEQPLRWPIYLVLLSVFLIPVLGRLLREGRWTSAGAVAVVPLVSYAVWAARGEKVFVSGLLVTSPVLWFGLWLLRKEDLKREPALLLGSVLVFGVAVLIGQYPGGGGTEWGGRFLAIGIPLLSVLAVTGLASLFVFAPRRVKTGLLLGAVGLSTVMGVLGVSVLGAYHAGTRKASLILSDLGARARVGRPHPANGDRPIILTNHDLIPVIDWPDFDRLNWVSTTRQPPCFYLERLREQKIDGFLLLERAGAKERFGEFLGQFGYEVRDSRPFVGFTVYLVAARGA